jgi:chorismate synthase
MPLSYVTAGESHGPGLTVVISGLPAGLELDHELIQGDLARRQAGYGRSPRQQLEQDDVDPRGGLRHGRTLGSPLAFFIQNRDHKNWTAPMSAWPVDEEALEEYGWRGSR